MILYDGFHKIEKKKVKIKGIEREIEKVLIKSAVAGVVVDIEGKVALVKQYRPCIEKTIYELPAGLLDKNLTPEETLIEELSEECGIDPSSIDFISKPVEYYTVCGSSDAKMYVMVVMLNSVGISKEVNDTDVERVDWFTDYEFQELLSTGEIQDAKTLYGYSLYKAAIS